MAGGASGSIPAHRSSNAPSLAALYPSNLFAMLSISLPSCHHQYTSADAGVLIGTFSRRSFYFVFPTLTPHLSSRQRKRYLLKGSLHQTLWVPSFVLILYLPLPGFSNHISRRRPVVPSSVYPIAYLVHGSEICMERVTQSCLHPSSEVITKFDGVNRGSKRDILEQYFHAFKVHRHPLAR